MNAPLRVPPDDVPTLTEVVRPSELVEPLEAPLAGHVGHAGPGSVDEERLTLQILWDVGARADALLESGLRTHLPPMLAQMAEQLTEQLLPVLRAELSAGLADVVREAISREIERSRRG